MSTKTKVISGIAAVAVAASVYLSVQTTPAVRGVYFSVWGSCTYSVDSMFAYVHPTYVNYFGGSLTQTPPYYNSFYSGSSDSSCFETGSPNYCGSQPVPLQLKLKYYKALYGTKLLISFLDNGTNFGYICSDTSVGGRIDQFIAATYGFEQRHDYDGTDFDIESVPNSATVRAGADVMFTRIKKRYPNMMINLCGPTWCEWTFGQPSTAFYNPKSFALADYVEIMGYNEWATMTNWSTDVASFSTALYHDPHFLQNHDDFWDNRAWKEYEKCGVRANQIVMGFSAEGHIAKFSATPYALGTQVSWITNPNCVYTKYPNIVWSTIQNDSTAVASYSIYDSAYYYIETPWSITQKNQYASTNNLAGTFVYDPWEWNKSYIQDADMAAFGGASVVLPPPIDTIPVIPPASNPLQWTQQELDSAKATVICPACPDTTGLFTKGAMWYKSLLPNFLTKTVTIQDTIPFMKP